MKHLAQNKNRIFDVWNNYSEITLLVASSLFDFYDFG